MKKYILTIVYDDNSDVVEWIQEEVIDDITPAELTAQNVSNLTSEDMEDIMMDKEYAKA
tara:strand:- start:2482 stop:2658 length:177 start_codon:yes stop_codon:yes gene_type:complete